MNRRRFITPFSPSSRRTLGENDRVSIVRNGSVYLSDGVDVQLIAGNRLTYDPRRKHQRKENQPTHGVTDLAIHNFRIANQVMQSTFVFPVPDHQEPYAEDYERDEVTQIANESSYNIDL